MKHETSNKPSEIEIRLCYRRQRSTKSITSIGKLMNYVLIPDMHRQGIGMATGRIRNKFLYARTRPVVHTHYPNPVGLINRFFMPAQTRPTKPHKPHGPI